MATRQLILQIPLLPFCMALLFALSPLLQAQPRLMADDEMDQVCAKGSAGFNVDPVTLNQMVFEFSGQTSLGQVTGSGVISVEAIPNSSGKSQILLGRPTTVPGGAQTTAGSMPVAIPLTDLQVVNGTVLVSGDLNISMQTLPSVYSALQQHRMVLPPGFNPFNTMQGMGGMR